MRCPRCNGKRGRVVATVSVIRKSPYGEWHYFRYTHRIVLKDGSVKRKYCYVRSQVKA